MREARILDIIKSACERNPLDQAGEAPSINDLQLAPRSCEIACLFKIMTGPMTFASRWLA